MTEQEIFSKNLILSTEFDRYILEHPEIAEKKSAGASIAEDTPQEHVLSESQTAAAAGADDSYLWWLGVLGLALAGGGAIYVSHRAGKKEWNIIEERAEGE